MKTKAMKLISLVLALCMTLSCLAGAVSAATFTDVKSSKWYYTAVTYCSENNLMSGYGDGTFGPTDTLTRAMFVQVLYNMSSDKGNYAGVSSGFSDVKSSAWYSDAVAWAVDKGITSGTSATTFSPTTAVTREQMATLVTNYLNAYGISLAESNDAVASFSDMSSVSSWAKSAVEYMRVTGIISGSNGLFRPKDTATRAEAATIFWKLDLAINAYEPAYDYTIYLVNATEVYTGYYYCYYIQTDNPDITSIGIDTDAYAYYIGYWADVESTYEDEWNTFMEQVDGGYIYTARYSSSGDLDTTIDIYEFDSYGNAHLVKSVPLQLINASTARDAWIQELIDTYTTEDMTPFEKMSAVVSYLNSSESGFTYLANDGTYLLKLTTKSGPYFVCRQWDSYTSPYVLCLIAEAIGGFDDIHNCYYDYETWATTHWLCKLTIGDESRTYGACPVSSTGLVTTITYVDFTDPSVLTFLG